MPSHFKTLSIVIIFALLPSLLFAETTRRAFSLKEFQSQLKTNGAGSSPVLAFFCGLTIVDGFIHDRENQDIVIYGHVDDESLPLHTGDFVIALRNAWMKYAELKGDTWYYSNPGCSIDPDPDVIGRLDDLAQRLNAISSVAGKDSAMQAWHDICRQPQTVRVFGIPFNTHFASVMVEADYLLKSITDGSYVPQVNGFTGLLPSVKSRLERDVQAGRPVKLGLAAMNRFWFYPGDCDFVYNDDMAGIARCPVVLLTEAQYVNKDRDQLVGTGSADPTAEQYTSQFTHLWPELAATEPLFAELDALFRLTALAKLMEYNKVRDHLNIDYLLDEYDINATRVPNFLKGVSNIERFEHTTEDEENIYTTILWLPSCGGVGMDIEVTPEQMTQDIEGKLDVLKKRVLKTKPKKNALFWDVGE